MSLATSCAHCGTVFRVAQDQLSASEGWVRCGHCRQVFNALERLFDLSDNGRSSPTSARPPVAAGGAVEAPRPAAPVPGFRYSESFAGQFQSPAVVGGAPLSAPAATTIDPTDPSWFETRPAAFSPRRAGGSTRSEEVDTSTASTTGGPFDAHQRPVPSPVQEAASSTAGRFYTEERSARVTGFGHEAPLPTSAFLRRVGEDAGGEASGASAMPGEGAASGQVGGDSVYVEDPGEATHTTFEATTWAVGWIPPHGDDGGAAEGGLPATAHAEAARSSGAEVPAAPGPSPVDVVCEAPSEKPTPATQVPQAPAPGLDDVGAGRQEPDFSTLQSAPEPVADIEVDIPITVMDEAALDQPLFHVVADPWRGAEAGTEARSIVAPSETRDVPVAPTEAARPSEGATPARRSPLPGGHSDFVPSTLDRPGELFLHSRWDESTDSVPVRGDAAAASPGVSEMPLESESAGVPRFVKEADRAARWRHPGVRAGLAALALLGLGVLSVQAAVQWRQPLLARWPQTQPWLDQACAWTHCRRDAPRRLDALVVDSTALSQPPGREGYRLQVQLSNRSDAEVAAPWIDLTLTDPAGGIIVRRMLAPGEFQQPEALAAHAEATWHLEFMVQGHTASGYTLGLFYP